MRVRLAGRLFFGGQDGLDRAEIDVNHARVGSLLHDTGDDVALFTLELPEHRVIRDVPEPLADDLLGGERGDATEVVGSGLFFADDGVVVVRHGNENTDMAGLPVHHHTGTIRRLARGRRVLAVGGQNRLLDDAHEFVEGDFLLPLDRLQQSEIDIHGDLPIQLSSTRHTRRHPAYFTGCHHEKPVRMSAAPPHRCYSPVHPHAAALSGKVAPFVLRPL